MRLEGLLVLGAGGVTAYVTESPVFLGLGIAGAVVLWVVGMTPPPEEPLRALLGEIEQCPGEAKDLLAFAAVVAGRLSEEKTRATDSRRVARIDGALASALRVARDYRAGRLAGPAPAEALTDELLSVERKTT